MRRVFATVQADMVPRPAEATRISTLGVVLGVILVIAGAVWLLVLVTADRADPDAVVGPATVGRVAVGPATPGLATVGPATLTTDAEFLAAGDLGTGSTEFSAVTINGDLNRLMIADDQDRLYEFSLDADGLPILPALRVIEIAIGAGDTEAIAWMYGSTFVIGSENSGQLMVVEIGDDVAMLGGADVLETIATGIDEVDGSGLEGVAYLGDSGPVRFAVVREKPPRLYLIGPDGVVSQSFALSYGIGDASDVAVASDGAIAVLSDESRRISTLRLDAEDSSVTVTGDGSLDLDSGVFAQPEGLVWSRDGTRLYVVGEGPGAGRYSFGIFAAGP